MHEIVSQLFVILTYGSIAQGLFVVLLLNHRSVRKSRANLFLSILIVSLTFSVTHILFAGRVITHASVNVYSMGDPTFTLVAPLLWFYVVELTGQRIRLSWQTALHFLPFFLVIAASLTFNSISSFSFASFIGGNHRLINIMFAALVVVQFSCYLKFIHGKWRSHQRRMQQEISNTENVNITWVRFFLIVFLLLNIFFLFSLFAVIHLHYGGWLEKTAAAMFSLSIFALSFKGILQREVFNTQDLEQTVRVTSLSPVAIDKHQLDRIHIYMTEKKPYLDAELTLTALASIVGMTRGELSQLINDGTGENFYDFVNKYRVEEVKRLMGDPGARHFSLLGIAMEAGFRSKSTFNLIFKRYTGLTPTEYRKNITQ